MSAPLSSVKYRIEYYAADSWRLAWTVDSYESAVAAVSSVRRTTYCRVRVVCVRTTVTTEVILEEAQV